MPELLTIPKELRLMIFEQLARSTVFRFPSSPDKINNPNVDHLAISQTCRQFYSEANSCLFLRHALLDCRGTEHALDALSAMTEEQLKSVRYLKFAGTPIVLQKGDDADSMGMGMEYSVYSAQVVLQLLFPELRLETLVYLDPHHGPSDWVLHSGRHFGDYQAYSQVTELVRYGNGWNQLHYMSTNTGFLQTTNKLPQPSMWDTLIKTRDGQSSGASTEIFIAKREFSGIEGAAGIPSMREPFDETAISAETQRLLTKLDEELAWYRNNKAILKRNVLVSIQRGRGAEHDGGGSIQGAAANALLKRLYDQKGWKGLKEDKLRWYQVMPYGGPNADGQP
jgi:hypothetical protein